MCFMSASCVLPRVNGALTYDVGQEQFGGVLAVVPMTVIDPLSE